MTTDTVQTLSGALAHYPAYRADLKKALLAALQEEAAGTSLTPCSDNIINMLAQLALAEPLARELLEVDKDEPPAYWFFTDGEITQETLIAGAEALSEMIFSDDPAIDAWKRNEWEGRLNAASLFLIAM